VRVAQKSLSSFRVTMSPASELWFCSVPRLVMFDARCGTCSMLCNIIVHMPRFKKECIFMLPCLAA
jgi:hypothetical protein